MKPFVLSSRAVNIRVHDYRLVIDDYFNRIRHEFPPHELPFDFLLVSNTTGNLSLSAIKFLVQHGVPVLFLDWNGKSTGTLLPPGPINGTLQIAQLRTYTDPVKRRAIAEAFLAEKYAKSIQLLRHLKRYYPALDPSPIQRESRSKVPEGGKDFRWTLMMKEGRVAECYLHELVKIVNQLAPEFGFRSRGQSSPNYNMSAADPFNVLLNVAYGILECWVRLTVNQAGFNESVGFLHEAQSGALPLVYDFMEPFRWLADFSVIQILERKRLSKADFVVTPELRLRMRSKSVRVVVDQMAVNFGRKTPSSGSQRKYEVLLADDARKLARFILGESSALSFATPFRVDDSHIDAELRERLLRLTVAERAALGIRKNTYHYIRKNITAGKPFRLYRAVRERLRDHEPD